MAYGRFYMKHRSILFNLVEKMMNLCEHQLSIGLAEIGYYPESNFFGKLPELTRALMLAKEKGKGVWKGMELKLQNE